MKTVIIKSLKLTNFKGIRSLELNKLSKETFVYADNGVGKTTLFDAFTWVLFGKDSSGRKDFEIKTLDSNNQVIQKIDHVVEVTIDVDGEHLELRRTLKEKWVTKRGFSEPEFTGNDNLFEWNGVPYNLRDYTSKINNIVDESVFKMITNPAAFNSMHWTKQRDVLIDMTGTITDQEIATGHPEFESLLSKLVGKTLEEYKKQVKASISKSKKIIKEIPSRIDEVQRGKPEPLDFNLIRTNINVKKDLLKNIDDQITDKLKAQQAIIDEKTKIKTDIQKLDFEISDIKHQYQLQARQLFRDQNNGDENINQKIKSKELEYNSAKNNLNSLKSKLESKKEDLTRKSEEIVGLRSKWDQVNSEKIIESDMDECCPTCSQKLPEADIISKREEMIGKLKADKQKRLDSINTKGKSLKAELSYMTKERDGIQEQIDSQQTTVDLISKDLEALKTKVSTDTKEVKSEVAFYSELLSNDKNIQPLTNKIEVFNKKMDAIKGVDVSDLKGKREIFNSEIKSLELQLSNEEEIKKHNTRINELSEEERQLGQAIADQEKDLFTIEAFEKEKSTRIEESVNNRFHMVNFKLFETQINGGEVPTCKALIDGVPFSDANTASKINAGLDIINTLCMHYKANAPIFIDNRESVVELLPTESQIINLIVSEDDKALRIEDRPLSYTEHVFKNKLEAV